MRRLLLARDSERGASLILVSFALVLLMGAAAIAVDLAAIRYDLRAAQLASDAASTAGAIHIDPVAGSDAEEACQVAWEYLLENIEDDASPIMPPDCTSFSGPCPPGEREVPASAGPYSLVITHPVPDAHALMAGQPINEDIDGAACQRLGVTVERTRDYTFGRVLGFVAGTPTANSVARIAVRPGEGELVPLLVLEPTGCNALITSGQGAVTVDFFEDVPGIIAVDSDGSKLDNPHTCSPHNRYTINSNDNDLNWIRANPTPDGIPSRILSYALPGSEKSYEEVDVTSGRLSPRPSPLLDRRITRAPIDHRYNCKPSYDPYLGFVPVYGCTSSDPPHIDNLRAAYGGSGNPGFVHRWTNHHPCFLNMAGTISESGNWWIDCPGGLSINQNTIVTLDGGDLVFDGGIDIGSDGQLHINPSESSDHVVFLRSGDLTKGGGDSRLTMRRTFVYMESGLVDVGGGADAESLQWSAPTNGNFEDLALWAEAPLQFGIGGQGGNSLEGTFFTPLANPFSLTGQAGQFQTSAQFLTRRLEVKGLGEVFMTPDPDRSTRLPLRGVMLIR
jgi:hypothetical protein